MDLRFFLKIILQMDLLLIPEITFFQLDFQLVL